MRRRPPSIGTTANSTLLYAEPTPTVLAYWEARVLRQRFTSHARPGSEQELFARIEHDGQWVYFPLESQLPEKAARRAWEIYRTLAADGWNAIRQNYARQMIWAVFWFTEPLACTYATLFTIPDCKTETPKETPAAAAKKIPVAIVEAEPEVLRGLEQSVEATNDYVCVRTAAGARELLQPSVVSSRQPRLILFNQHSLDLAAESFQRQLQARWPGVVALPFGIFGHSDELFMSVTGMDRGYFLRRRPPTQILEPLAGFWPGNATAPEPASVRVRQYFQKLLHPETPASTLSQREMEIMRYLGAGQTDKTIASLLNISAWTVHSHMKSIFEKLGVHTRAEAVMRYLQR